MKQGYELFKAHGYSAGQDPIVLGINYARLGLDRFSLLTSYTARYGEDFFAEFVDGYANAFDDEYTKHLVCVIIPVLDVDFILHNLMKVKTMRDFAFGEITYNPIERNQGLSTKTSVSCSHNVHKIQFTITFYEYIHADGSHSNSWQIDSNISHNCQRERFHRGRMIEVDDIRWLESHQLSGSNIDGFWYEVRGRWNAPTPHSSSVAKLIVYFIDNYIEQFKLMAVVESKVTLGELMSKVSGGVVR